MAFRLDATLATILLAFFQVALTVAVSHQSSAVSLRSVVGQMPGLSPETQRVANDLAKKANESIHKCTVKDLKLKTLAGEWVMAYYKEPVDGLQVEIYLKHVDDGVVAGGYLQGLMSENGEEPPHAMYLFPLQGTNGILLNLLPMKQIAMRILVLVMAAKKDQYFTVFTLGFGIPATIDWAIYVRPNVTLSKIQQVEATAGLACLQLNKGSNMPLVQPVGRSSGSS